MFKLTELSLLISPQVWCVHNAWTYPALDHGKDSYTRVSILGSDNSSPRHICHVNLVLKARRTTLSLQYVELLLTIFRLLWPSLAACCPTCTGFYGHTNWKFTSLPLHGEEGRSNWERPSQPPAPHGSGMATTCSTLRGALLLFGLDTDVTAPPWTLSPSAVRPRKTYSGCSFSPP